MITGYLLMTALFLQSDPYGALSTGGGGFAGLDCGTNGCSGGAYCDDSGNCLDGNQCAIAENDDGLSGVQCGRCCTHHYADDFNKRMDCQGTCPPSTNNG